MIVGRRALLGAVPAFFLPRTGFGRILAGAGADTAARPALPKIVLIERDPWAMVIGSDSPTFALYDDGKAIYLTKAGYRSVDLSTAEMAALLAGVDAPALPALARHYDAAAATDQPTEILAVYDGDKPAIISVYGSLKSPDIRKAVPAKIAAAYDRLTAFTHVGATDWLPEKIEVMIWPYDYAPEKSIVWPAGWPGLDSPDAVKRRDGAYSLFVPSAKLPELKRFLETRREKGAVEIGGKKWAVDLRLPFPGEQSWMRGA